MLFESFQEKIVSEQNKTKNWSWEEARHNVSAPIFDQKMGSCVNLITSFCEDCHHKHMRDSHTNEKKTKKHYAMLFSKKSSKLLSYGINLCLHAEDAAIQAYEKEGNKRKRFISYSYTSRYEWKVKKFKTLLSLY